MQTLETVKTRSQATFNTLLEKGKEQPDEVKTWGITAGGAVVGALVVTAAAKGVLAILATLAAPPVALTVGALGGGALGWNYLRNQRNASSTETATNDKAVPDGVTGTNSATLTPEAPVVTEQVSTPPVPVPSQQPRETVGMTASIKSDNLEAINGIGPVYSSRLLAAGIQTFAQLAELTPERIHEIIGETRSGHMIEAERWIAEASQLAAGGDA